MNTTWQSEARCQKFFKTHQPFALRYLPPSLLYSAFASSREKGFCTNPLKTLPLRLPKDEGFLDSSLKMKMQTSAGIIVNTFEKLEPRVIRAIVDGKWMLISSKGGDNGRSPESLAWLDSQPRGSIGKLFLTHRPSLSIHILITNQAYDVGSTTTYISFVSATVPSIVFHFFLATTLPPDFSTTSPHHELLRLRAPSPQQPQRPPNPHFISENHVVHGLIIDSFWAPLVTQELNIPCYYFFPSGACVLNFFLYAPTFHDNEVLPLIL